MSQPAVGFQGENPLDNKVYPPHPRNDHLKFALQPYGMHDQSQHALLTGLASSVDLSA